MALNLGKTIRIKAGDITVIAKLNDTKSAQAIWEALPFKGYANRWGDEIYFSIPVHAAPEEGQELVDLGDLGYWLGGRALCIFFGPTPMSRGDEIRPAGPVPVVGKIVGDAKVLKQVASGTEILVERENES